MTCCSYGGFELHLNHLKTPPSICAVSNKIRPRLQQNKRYPSKFILLACQRNKSSSQQQRLQKFINTSLKFPRTGKKLAKQIEIGSFIRSVSVFLFPSTVLKLTSWKKEKKGEQTEDERSPNFSVTSIGHSS